MHVSIMLLHLLFQPLSEGVLIEFWDSRILASLTDLEADAIIAMTLTNPATHNPRIQMDLSEARPFIRIIVQVRTRS